MNIEAEEQAKQVADVVTAGLADGDTVGQASDIGYDHGHRDGLADAGKPVTVRVPVCPICAAVVADSEAHLRWHEGEPDPSVAGGYFGGAS